MKQVFEQAGIGEGGVIWFGIISHVQKSSKDCAKSSYALHSTSPNIDISRVNIWHTCQNQGSDIGTMLFLMNRLYSDFICFSTLVLFLFQDPNRIPCCTELLRPLIGDSSFKFSRL